MNKTLALVLLALVLVPLAALGALGLRLAREDEDRGAQRARELMRSTLRSLDGEIHDLLEERERQIGSLLDEVGAGVVPVDPDDLRLRTRSVPGLRQTFVIDPRTDRWLYPSLLDPLNAEEDGFLRRMREVRLRPGEGRGSAGAEAGDSLGESRGWQAYFWSDGLHLLYWWRGEAGLVVGAELGRVRFLADVIAALPDTDVLAPRLEDARIRLLGADGEVHYQWGGLRAEGPEGKAGAGQRHPRVRLALSRPLAAWSLEYTARGTATSRALLGFLPGLLALVAVVVSLAVYFYRESSRELRDAARRVSFVNQVSHELKTPLTNIRMYAELLEADLTDEDEAARQRAAVITAESQRLSRLILNILTFHRQQRRELELRPATGVLDDVITWTLGSFRPAFVERGIEIHFDAGAPRPMIFDRDAVEQIVGNLLSNVEKYAVSGRRVDLASVQEEDVARVTVSDRGPGIAAPHRRRIFQPFYRISNQTRDGVSGTGLGLALARDLARLHGGDLEWMPSPCGACFQLTLPSAIPRRRVPAEKENR